jgi:hypothetical protein
MCAAGASKSILKSGHSEIKQHRIRLTGKIGCLKIARHFLSEAHEAAA